MGSYIARRLLHMIPVLLMISIFIFFLVRLIPGDPASVILGDKASEETVAALRSRLNLDEPIIVQYGTFLKDALSGDLGTSVRRGEPVVDVILQRMPPTLFLAAYAAILSVVISVPLATVAALNNGRWPDKIVRAFAMVSLAMPAYWVGMMLLQLFAVKYDILPVAGYGDGFFGHLESLLLPALALALSIASVLIRSLRNSLLETLSADYVRTARAKGLTGRQVYMRHVLRTSALSTITILGVNLAYLVGGAAVTETIFAIPGIGQMVVRAIFDRDYPLIQGATLAFGILVLTVNLITDLIYATLDPRVSYA
jgi:peptide/nickel transport system permease protein